jgi:hypothetical protein
MVKLFRNAVAGAVVSEYVENHGDSSPVGFGITRDEIVAPSVPFKTCQEYYKTVGKVQNTIESFISQVINRDWFFEAKDEKDEEVITTLNNWSEQIGLSKFIEDLARNWLIHGHVLIGKTDLLHVQYSSIVGMVRDEYGHPIKFVQQVGYNTLDLEAKDFFESPFIELDRGGWGFGLYHSLMMSYFEEGKQSTPLLSIYRRMEQDISKIHHKYASPRTILAFPEASSEQMSDDIIPLVKQMKQGDRLALNYRPELISESVDAKARFTESIEQINAEIESGLQSSSSRLITNPSAMADATVASAQDDERVQGLMEKIRRFIDEEILPSIIGEKNRVFFKWGSKDSFDLEFPNGLTSALNAGVITTNDAREILKARGWKIEDVPEEQPQPQQTFSDQVVDMLADKNADEQEALKLKKLAYEKILNELKKKPKKKRKYDSKGSSKKSSSA